MPKCTKKYTPLQYALCYCGVPGEVGIEVNEKADALSRKEVAIPI